MRYVGIDPGVTGAIAIMRDPQVAFTQPQPEWEILDIPTVTIKVGKKNRTILDLREMWKIIIHCAGSTTHFLLESPVMGPAMRGRDGAGDGSEIAGQSVVTLANSFRLNGQIEAMLAIAAETWQSKYEMVNPQVWKRQVMPGEARDKEAARQKAIQLFPSMAEHLKLKKHHNRAEALLLAEWGRRTR